jgi:hypothetical protein
MREHHIVTRIANHCRKTAKVSTYFYKLVRRIKVVCRFVLDAVDGNVMAALAQPACLLVDHYIYTEAASHPHSQDGYVKGNVTLVIHGMPMPFTPTIFRHRLD